MRTQGASSHNEAIDDMLNFLEEIHCGEADYFVDGVPLEKKKAVSRAVMAKNIYMPDFIPGTDGKIKQVHFNRLRDKKDKSVLRNT